MESTNPICKQIDESLDAFHDGELKPAERAVVEEHLQTCAYCTAKLADIGRLVSTLKSMPRADVPSGLSSKLDDIIDQQNKVVAMRSRWQPIAMTVAAAAVALIGGIALTTQQPGAHVATQVAPQPVQVAQQPAPTQPAPAPAVVAPRKQEVTPVVAQAPKPVIKPQVLAAPPRSEDPPAQQPKPSTASSEEIAELPTVTNSFTDAIGIATDEDGLYDIKM